MNITQTPIKINQTNKFDSGMKMGEINPDSPTKSFDQVLSLFCTSESDKQENSSSLQSLLGKKSDQRDPKEQDSVDTIIINSIINHLITGVNNVQSKPVEEVSDSSISGTSMSWVGNSNIVNSTKSLVADIKALLDGWLQERSSNTPLASLNIQQGNEPIVDLLKKVQGFDDTQITALHNILDVIDNQLDKMPKSLDEFFENMPSTLAGVNLESFIDNKSSHFTPTEINQTRSLFNELDPKYQSSGPVVFTKPIEDDLSSTMPITELAPGISDWINKAFSDTEGKKGQVQTHISFMPRSYGNMEIKILFNQGQPKVDIIVDRVIGRQAIEDSIPQIIQNLQHSGLTLTEVKITEKPNLVNVTTSETRNSFKEVNYLPITYGKGISGDRLELSTESERGWRNQTLPSVNTRSSVTEEHQALSAVSISSEKDKTKNDVRSPVPFSQIVPKLSNWTVKAIGKSGKEKSEIDSNVILLPDKLGSVKISLSQDNGHLKLKLLTDNVKGQEVLMDQLSNLSGALEQKGLVVEQMVVSLKEQSSIDPVVTNGERKFLAKYDAIDNKLIEPTKNFMEPNQESLDENVQPQIQEVDSKLSVLENQEIPSNRTLLNSLVGQIIKQLQVQNVVNSAKKPNHLQGLRLTESVPEARNLLMRPLRMTEIFSGTVEASQSMYTKNLTPIENNQSVTLIHQIGPFMSGVHHTQLEVSRRSKDLTKGLVKDLVPLNQIVSDLSSLIEREIGTAEGDSEEIEMNLSQLSVYLGNSKIQFSKDNGTLNLRFVTDNIQGHQVLTDQLPKVAEVLQQKGIAVKQIEVSLVPNSSVVSEKVEKPMTSFKTNSNSIVNLEEPLKELKVPQLDNSAEEHSTSSVNSEEPLEPKVPQLENSAKDSFQGEVHEQAYKPKAEEKPQLFGHNTELQNTLTGQSVQQLQVPNLVDTGKTIPQRPLLPLAEFVPEVSNWLGKSMRITEGESGILETSFSLYPNHLGPIKVKISSQKGKIEAQIFTANFETTEALESQLPHLKQAMQQHGLVVQKLDIIQQPQPIIEQTQSNLAFAQHGGTNSSNGQRSFTSNKEEKKQKPDIIQEVEPDSDSRTYSRTSTRTSSSIDFTA